MVNNDLDNINATLDDLAETDSKNLTQAKPLKLLALQWKSTWTKRLERSNPS